MEHGFDYGAFMRDRITQLRLQANISEYRLSEGIGKNKGYINRMVNGDSLPSMHTFFDICE